VSVRIQAFGRPAPKGSRSIKVSHGKAHSWPNSKHEAPWIAAVQEATEGVMRYHEPVEPPYAVDLRLLLSKPQRPKHRWPTAHDLDKLARAVVDGLVKGGAMIDDRHVIELHAAKEFVSDPEQAGVIAYVYKATTAEQRAA
jgi:Holliday junction resolvase RusA-like endonuclease